VGAGAHTDFEYYSHEEMLAMVEHADPNALHDFGDRLTKAVHSIHTIGKDLNDHIGYLEWHGESGSAFKEWGKQVAKATLSLGDYAQTAGKAMTDAAQTLTEVKRDMPKVPAGAKATVDTFRTSTAAHHDPDFRKEYSKANGQLESARIEAADQMKKLAQSYSLSTSTISKETPPTYPPAPKSILPQVDHRDRTNYSTTSSNTSTTRNSYGSPTERHSTVSPPYPRSESHITSHTTVDPAHVKPVVVHPTTDTTHLTSTTQVQTPTTPVPTVPDQRPTGPVSPTVPRTFLPPAAPPSLPVPPGGTGPTSPGLFRSGLASPLPNEFQGGRGPMGTPGVRPRVPNGIYGGRPVAEEEGLIAGRTQPQIARGSVVGGRGAAARPPVGGVGGGATGGIAGGRGGARSRLVTEEGGEVGRTPAGAFVRSGTPREDEQREAGRRPDHLVEDEETWARRGDVAPPVID
jgi:uncharacterized protein YukE